MEPHTTATLRVGRFFVVAFLNPSNPNAGWAVIGHRDRAQQCATDLHHYATGPVWKLSVTRPFNVLFNIDQTKISELYWVVLAALLIISSVRCFPSSHGGKWAFTSIIYSVDCRQTMTTFNDNLKTFVLGGFRFNQPPSPSLFNATMTAYTCRV